MRAEMEQFHERLDRIENANQRPQPQVPNIVRRGRAQQRDVEEEYDAFDENDFDKEDN